MKRQKKWLVEKEADYEAFIPDILDFCLPNRKWKLCGEMGAGKTTFVKALGDFLGIDEVSSPTFAIVNEYHVPGQHADEIGPFIHHIDLYRLEEEEEIVGIGLEEYLNDPYLTIVEWPEISKMLWPEEYVELKLAELEEGKRELLIILHIS